MARYEEIADSLRKRIEAEEWPVGDKLPGISALQEEYEVPGLGTIRAAQRILVAEGMLRTRQGVGAIVTSTRSLRRADPADLLKTAGDALNAAIEVLEAKAKHTIVFDLDDEDTYYVLTQALGEWAADQRHHAENELGDDAEDPTAASRLARAESADHLLERIEASL